MKMVKAAWAAPAEILYYLFEDPTWFLSMGLKGAPLLLAGEVIVWSVNVLIMVSTVAFCVETVPQYSSNPHANPDDFETWVEIWSWVEILCVAVFTLDFTVRAACCWYLGTGAAFWEDIMNWVDILAIAPFFLTKVWPNMIDLRFMRVIRLTRVLKSMGKKMERTGGLVAAIVVKAAPALGLPIFLMMLSCMMLSGLAYYAEQTSRYICVLDEPIPCAAGYDCMDGSSWQMDRVDPWIPVLGYPGTEGCSKSDPVTTVDASGNRYPYTSGISLTPVDTFGLELPDMTTKAYGLENETYSNGKKGNYGDHKAWMTSFEMMTVGEAMTEGEFDLNEDGDIDGAEKGPHFWGCACPGSIAFVGHDKVERSSEIFPGVDQALWWTIVTYTTVGYGDINPQTWLGQLFATVTMFVGVFFLAMPLAIVGGTFTTEYNFTQNQLEQEAKLDNLTDEEKDLAIAEETAKASDDVQHRLKEFGPVTAHASVKAHFHRVRILAQTLYSVTPDDETDIKEAMGKFLLKLKAADYNCKQMELQHDKDEDDLLAEPADSDSMVSPSGKGRRRGKGAGGMISPRSLVGGAASKSSDGSKSPKSGGRK